MSLNIWEVFQTLIRWNAESEAESSDEADEDGFVPSPLDLSVRTAHGGADDTAVRELSRIEEQAKELEQTRHDE